MTSTGAQLTMVRGIVTTAKEQMQSVRVDRKTGYGRINTTPELWLRDGDDKQHRYQGDMFNAAQPGHDVAVVTKAPSGKPVAFANFTTGVVHDGSELSVSTSLGSNLISTLGLSVFFALPGLFVWGIVLETLGLGEKAFATGGFQVYIVLLVVCVYAGLTFWSKAYRERADALREDVDRLLSQAQVGESR
ncbi:hypothetical protein [uncultured Roseobacter sp.]|uniref:hypothetical protein n=1 Tax=uncultured Roseobacter sp. TaxID=114847 RepID=UPI00261CD684|nr:hypothetical protein [uncultured Roseobacter sp.]